MTDPWTDANLGYVDKDDLDGRLLLVIPTDKVDKPSKSKPGETYEAVFADVVVLDGGTNEAIKGLGVKYLIEDFQFTGKRARQLMDTWTQAKMNGTTPMLLGRQNSQKAQSGGKAYAFAPPTESDKAVARPHAQEYLSKPKEYDDVPF